MRAIAWQTIANHLFIFFGADNEENVHGVMHLVRGVNGKYRALESSHGPSQYTAIKTYILSDPNFMWLMEQSELEQELGLLDKDITGLHIEDIRLLDKNGRTLFALCLYGNRSGTGYCIYTLFFEKRLDFTR